MPDGHRILLLGAGGFVGTHLRRTLTHWLSDPEAVIATTYGSAGGDMRAMDLRDTDAVVDLVSGQGITHVVNLAGIAAPAKVRSQPDLAWELHALAPERLARALLARTPDCWFLHVSSGLIYGRTALAVDRLSEGAVLAPMDPYAVTKAAGDLALCAVAEEGGRCLRLRPFNHTGPGQTEDFVVPAFAAQIARIRKGAQPPVIKVGNLEAERDFLDVRDVAEAYRTVIAKSDGLVPGAVYNIASGQGWRIADVLDRLVGLSGLDIQVEPDPERQRPSDVPRIVGDAARLQEDTGWTPSFTMDQTLIDTLDFFLRD